MESILVFRTGSIGDTCIALPTLWFIKNHYKNSRINILTNYPVSGLAKECPLSQVLNGSGIVNEYIEYPVAKLNLKSLLLLWFKIRAINPDVLIYLMPKRSRGQLVRDWIIFKICGIRKIVGLHILGNYQKSLYNAQSYLWEHEAYRLGRLIDSLGIIDCKSFSSWSLALTSQEYIAAMKSLQGLMGSSFFALSIGTKVDVKDWGEDNWFELSRQLTYSYPKHALVLIGSRDEYDRCQSIIAQIQTPALNLCGQLSPRISAAVIEKADLFIGHDSGPMHLAAAVGTPVVAIFSARNKPGEWYPGGPVKNMVLYHKTECFGCNLSECVIEKKKCIRAITVAAVLNAVSNIIKA